MTGNIVIQHRKTHRWWTPERRKVVWDMYVAGATFEDIAEHFKVTVAAAQRQVYNCKKR